MLGYELHGPTVRLMEYFINRNKKLTFFSIGFQCFPNESVIKFHKLNYQTICNVLIKL